MAEKIELYCPAAKDVQDIDLFGARFPLVRALKASNRAMHIDFLQMAKLAVFRGTV